MQTLESTFDMSINTGSYPNLADPNSYMNEKLFGFDYTDDYKSRSETIIYGTRENIIFITSNGTGATFTKHDIEAQSDWIIFFKEFLKGIDRPVLLSTGRQIEGLSELLGLNMSEIALIMNVSRAAIYSWIDDGKRLRTEHQKRLDEFVEICSFWKKINGKRLGGYFRKIVNGKKQSLLDLLKEEKLNKTEIFDALENISTIIKNKNEKIKSHEMNLKERGFKELSEEEKNINLDKITHKIG